MIARLLTIATLALAASTCSAQDTTNIREIVRHHHEWVNFDACECWCDEDQEKLGLWIIESSSMYSPYLEQGIDGVGNRYSWECIPEQDADLRVGEDEFRLGDKEVFCDNECLEDENSDRRRRDEE